MSPQPELALFQQGGSYVELERCNLPFSAQSSWIIRIVF